MTVWVVTAWSNSKTEPRHRLLAFWGSALPSVTGCTPSSRDTPTCGKFGLESELGTGTAGSPEGAAAEDAGGTADAGLATGGASSFLGAEGAGLGVAGSVGAPTVVHEGAVDGTGAESLGECCGESVGAL